MAESKQPHPPKKKEQKERDDRQFEKTKQESKRAQEKVDKRGS